jgi:hypothetical protein
MSTIRRRLDKLQAAFARLTAATRRSPTSNDHMHNLTNDQLTAIIGIDPSDLSNLTNAQLLAIINGTALEATP